MKKSFPPGKSPDLGFLTVGVFGLAFGWLACAGDVWAGPEDAHSVRYEFHQNRGELADTVILKNGKVFTNVKTFPQGGVHIVRFQNGQSMSVPNATIKIVRIQGVSWTIRPPVQQAVALVAHKRQPREQAPARVVPPFVPLERQILPTQPDQKAEAIVEQEWQMGPVTRSLLVPGWGQWWMGYRTRAAIIVAMGVPIVQAYWVHRSEHTEAQSLYSETLTPYLLAQPENSPWGVVAYYSVFNFRRSTLLGKENETNAAVYALLGLWALQALDAYYVHTADGGTDPFFKFAPKISFTNDFGAPTTLLAFSDGKNFIIGFGVHF